MNRMRKLGIEMMLVSAIVSGLTVAVLAVTL